ncbi:MAG: metallophosphoesterase [Polyangiaceae bacterium]|nr:metallophosphoesterase [Polyangiaceae bacterium]
MSRRCRGPCVLALFGALGSACVRPAEERARQDETVGSAAIEGLEVSVRDGLAAIRRLAPGRIHLWASAPSFDLAIRTAEPRVDLELLVDNCMPGATLTDSSDKEWAVASARVVVTQCRWRVDLEGGKTVVRVAPAAKPRSSLVDFAVLSDVQEAVDRVQDIFERMNQQPELDFVLSTGDLTSRGTDDELGRFQSELETLRVPFFTTLGNHELGSSPPEFHRFFGRGSQSFTYGDVRFTTLDAANATIDPLVYGWLDEWLERGADQTHVVAMHYPPLDPIGVRNGAFSSRSEAGKLLGKLSAAGVDLTLYGHIHSFYAFENAGIAAYISGGGGAIPERFDGIGRHFLMVHADPARQTVSVRVERVDG